jgi:hypothetical protein
VTVKEYFLEKYRCACVVVWVPYTDKMTVGTEELERLSEP